MNVFLIKFLFGLNVIMILSKIQMNIYAFTLPWNEKMQMHFIVFYVQQYLA